MDSTQQDPGARSMSPEAPLAWASASSSHAPCCGATAPPRTPRQERAPPSLRFEQNPQDSTLAMFPRD